MQSDRLHCEGGGERPSHRATVCHRACAVQSSSNRGQDVGGHLYRRLLLASSGVSGSRQHGVNGQQPRAVPWQPCSVTCSKADRRSSAHALDGEAASGLPGRQLDGVAKEALQAQRGIILGCAFATGSSNCCWWDRFGRGCVPHELEFASTCMAAKLTKKSKVLSNSVSVRAKLQTRLAPLGVQATRTERNLGLDFASGKRVSTVVRRARLQKSYGRAKRTRTASRRCHCGVAVTGLNETQLQHSRSQVASCLRMHGKSATMVLDDGR